jgi:hypothetical protein
MERASAAWQSEPPRASSATRAATGAGDDAAYGGDGDDTVVGGPGWESPAQTGKTTSLAARVTTDKGGSGDNRCNFRVAGRHGKRLRELSVGSRSRWCAAGSTTAGTAKRPGGAAVATRATAARYPRAAAARSKQQARRACAAVLSGVGCRWPGARAFRSATRHRPRSIPECKLPPTPPTARPADRNALANPLTRWRAAVPIPTQSPARY